MNTTETVPPGDQAEPGPDAATIVFCVERGRLEREALLMLESLRRWGGGVGRSRVLGVMPRRDRPLRRETVAGLESFGVELIDGSAGNTMKWYNWYNKIVAARLAERLATTPVVIWLDCDVLALGPLRELALPGGHDFAARRDPCAPAVFEKGSERQVGYWRRACAAVGVDPEAIPWLPADDPTPRQKLTFNAGVFAFRRGKGFVEVYDDFTRRMNRAGVAYAGDCFWFNEQNALALAVVDRGLKFRELARRDHHMIFLQDPLPAHSSPPRVPDARLVHYGRSLAPAHWPRFLARFEEEFPDRVEWLRSKGPAPPEPPSRDPIYFGRKLYRRLRSKLQERRCARVSAAWERAHGGAACAP